MENILAGNDKVAMLVTLIRQLSGDAALSGFMGMPELQTSLAAANDVAHEVLARMKSPVRNDTVLANISTNSAVQDQKCKKDQKCTDCGKAFYPGPGHHGKASNCFRCGNPEKARLWNAKSSASNGPWRRQPVAAASPAPVVHAVEAPREEAPDIVFGDFPVEAPRQEASLGLSSQPPTVPAAVKQPVLTAAKPKVEASTVPAAVPAPVTTSSHPTKTQRVKKREGRPAALEEAKRGGHAWGAAATQRSINQSTAAKEKKVVGVKAAAEDRHMLNFTKMLAVLEQIDHGYMFVGHVAITFCVPNTGVFGLVVSQEDERNCIVLVPNAGGFRVQRIPGRLLRRLSHFKKLDARTVMFEEWMKLEAWDN